VFVWWPICSPNRSPWLQPFGEQHLLRTAKGADSNRTLLICVQSPVGCGVAGELSVRPLSDSGQAEKMNP
jgi:hypothetical protein